MVLRKDKLSEISGLNPALAVASGGTGESTSRLICGLRFNTSAAFIRIYPGTAFIPGIGRSVTLSEETLINLNGLAPSTWQNVYLYENGGVAAIEISAIAPVAYSYPAQHKTGDPSRRYVGSFRVAASGSILEQTSIDGHCHYISGWEGQRMLSAGVATTLTAINVGTVVPEQATAVTVAITNSSTVGGYVVYVTCRPTDGGPTTQPGGKIVYTLPLFTYPNIYYRLNGATSGAAAYIDVGGYDYAR